jgi:hypothetical protein
MAAMADLPSELEEAVRTILGTGDIPAGWEWTSECVAAWVGEVDRVRARLAEVEELLGVERAATMVLGLQLAELRRVLAGR